MNGRRRKELEVIKSRYSALYIELMALGGKFDDLRGELGNIMDEEQESYDSRTENSQLSESGQQSEQAVEYLQEALALIEAIVETCEASDETEFHEAIDNAQGN